MRWSLFASLIFLGKVIFESASMDLDIISSNIILLPVCSFADVKASLKSMKYMRVLYGQRFPN